MPTSYTNNFGLTLDTVAPSGTIVAANPAIFKGMTQTLTITGASGDPKYMKVWLSHSNSDSKASSGYTGASWIQYASSFSVTFPEEGTYYAHLVLMDEVGNESGVSHSALMNYDSTAPTFSFTIYDRTSNSQIITNEETIKLALTSCVDTKGSATYAAASGVVEIKITGNCTAVTLTNADLSSSAWTGDVILTNGAKKGGTDGARTVTVTVKDAAGNTTSASKSITLDTTQATPVVTLEKNTTSTHEALPSYINYTIFKLHIATGSSDVIGYKYWGDIVDHTTKPTDYTTISAGTTLVELPDLNFTSTDGVKNVYVQVKDSAENESDVISAHLPTTLTVDMTNPVISAFSTSSRWISSVSGHNSATISATFAAAVSGLASYSLTIGGVVKDSGTSLASPHTWTVTPSDWTAGTSGDKAVVLTLTDNAGNHSTSTLTVGLDITAPTPVINALSTWYNKTTMEGSKFSITVTISAESQSGSDTIYAWVSGVASDTTIPSGTTAVAYTSDSQLIPSTGINWTGLADTPSNYMHVCVVDKVGNKGYAHRQFGCDRNNPTGTIVLAGTVVNAVGTGVSSDSATNTVSIHATITYSDTNSDGSGVSQFQISGDVDSTATNTAWQNVTSTPATLSITLSGSDGSKRVSVQFKDNAGNLSTIYQSAVIELDRTTPAATLSLYRADGTTPLPHNVAYDEFKAKVGYTSDDPLGGTSYKLYGDFNTTASQVSGISETAAAWTAFSGLAASNAGVIVPASSNYFLTTGDGEKHVYLKVRDNVGHVSTEIYSIVVLDTTLPLVNISGVTNYRVSCQHVLRKQGTGSSITDKTGDYCDVTTFSFTPNEKIIGYKICAYTTEAAAKAADPATATPIAQSYQVSGSYLSSLLSATGVSYDANAAVSIALCGEDYRTALGGSDSTNVDGAHYVVVYVQDEAEQWSSAFSTTLVADDGTRTVQ